MTAAEKLRRLTRLYAVSSGINSAIVRIPEERLLFQEACRIAVDEGGLTMAWVGLAQADSPVLAPVARWGNDAGYLDAVQVHISADHLQGQGPGGVAFRGGLPAICNDIENEGQSFASRGAALARGYRSCGAFPLKLAGASIGVFVVYADEAGYFDSDEMKLLTALADNFSFAIESRRKDRALRESEARLRAVIDNEPECVATIGLEGRLLEMNPAGLRFLQATRASDVLGRQALDFIHPEDREEFCRLHAKVVAGGTHQAQLRTVGLGGDLLWMDHHMAPLRLDGEVSAVLSVSRDVTQQRESLALLHHGASLLSMASRLGHIGAWDVELPQQRLTWTDELCAIHDVAPGFRPTLEEALSFYVAADRPRVEVAFRRCCQQAAPFDMEVDLLTASGRLVHGRLMGEGVPGADGRMSRVQGAFQDITERRAAREQIVELNARLEHRVRERTAQLELANHELGAFSYSVAHDLRAPLAAISGFSQALEHELANGTSASNKSRHYLERMRVGLKQTHEMIDAMLSLSQLSRAQLRWDDVDLAAMARAAFDNLREQEPGRGAELVIEQPLPARGDPRLLQLVLDNLVGNAWKFSAGEPRAHITVGRQAGEETPVYFVRDNGVGFDMAYSAKLFGAFQRLHSQAEFPGTGVGLANVWRIVSRHGGRIWAQAAPGKGATFYFTLGELSPA